MEARINTTSSLRECDCPNWILQCVHFGEYGVALADTNEAQKAVAEGGRHWFETRYAIVGIPFIPCNECGEPHLTNHAALGYVDRAEGYEEALRYFHEAELALLRGDSPQRSREL